MRSLTISFLASLVLLTASNADILFLDGENGDDLNTGLAEDQAWKTLSKANGYAFKPGDALKLKRGTRFSGGLSLKLDGTAEAPIVIGAYGEGALPLIDAKGYIAGVHLKNSHHVVMGELEITADGGKTVDGSNPGFRYGVYVQATGGGSTSNVVIDGLVISKIYPEIAKKHEGINSTTFLGSGVAIEGSEGSVSGHFTISECEIREVGFKGVSLQRVRNVEVIGNSMTDIGGPGIQPGRVDDLVVRGNVVTRSGSSLDPRMHQRGSGIWPWTCKRVLIEKNTFMHARGAGDSCGIHIDFNCSDVIVQYNLSIDNEGGFAEILGNNYNCTYRYNISVNDGSRVKGEDKAFQEGKTLMTSGYVGNKKPKKGPYNSYIYNNTVYVKEGSRSCFSVGPSTAGLLVANNIFHILGETVNVLDDQDKRADKRVAEIKRTIVRSNLYISGGVLPEYLPFKDETMFIGDAGFRRPGGLDPADYTPGNIAAVKDRGIEIPKLPGDEKGLMGGLKVETDFLGNPIVGLPDIGAIEVQ
jgi:hypothetical protein